MDMQTYKDKNSLNIFLLYLHTWKSLYFFSIVVLLFSIACSISSSRDCELAMSSFNSQFSSFTPSTSFISSSPDSCTEASSLMEKIENVKLNHAM